MKRRSARVWVSVPAVSATSVFPPPRSAISAATLRIVGASNRTEIGKLHVPGLADLGEEAHRDQRVPAQIEETVFGADLLDPQKITPEPGQRGLDRAFGLDIIAVELGPLEGLAALAAGVVAFSGLGDQLGQGQRTDDDLGRVQRQGAQEHPAALFGADTLAEIVAQPFLGRRERPRRVLLRGADRGLRGLDRDGEAGAAFHAADREAGHLDADIPVRGGQGDVRNWRSPRRRGCRRHCAPS